MDSIKPQVLDLSSLSTSQAGFATLVKEALGPAQSEYPKLHLLHVAFKEDEPDIHSLAEIACDQVINYVIPKRKIKQAADASAKTPFDASIWSALQREARAAFIRYNENSLAKSPNASSDSNTRYAEIGEVIAFCLACHYLEAGQVAAKMALKTNSQMPGYGVDGIHARAEDDGTLTVFFLEAKMVNDAKSGMTQYLDSSTKFYSDRRQKANEQRIARDLSNFDILESAAKDAAIDYFNPYNGSSSRVRERFVGVIIYDEELYKNKLPLSDTEPLDIHEKHFVSKYIALHPDLLDSCRTKLTNRDSEHARYRAYYIAVPSTSELKRLFSEAMKK